MTDEQIVRAAIKYNEHEYKCSYESTCCLQCEKLADFGGDIRDQVAEACAAIADSPAHIRDLDAWARLHPLDAALKTSIAIAAQIRAAAK